MVNSSKKLTGKSIKMRTNEVLFDRVHISTPLSWGDGRKTFSITMLFSKDDSGNKEKFLDAIKSAYNVGKSEWEMRGQTVPELEKFKLPLRYGDKEHSDNTAYQGHYFVCASSRYQPRIVDAYKREISNVDAIRSGCIGRAQLAFYLYEHDGSYGIGCGLVNLQKLEDGESLHGDQDEDFDFPIGRDVPDDDDDDDDKDVM